MVRPTKVTRKTGTSPCWVVMVCWVGFGGACENAGPTTARERTRNAAPTNWDMWILQPAEQQRPRHAGDMAVLELVQRTNRGDAEGRRNGFGPFGRSDVRTVRTSGAFGRSKRSGRSGSFRTFERSERERSEQSERPNDPNEAALRSRSAR